MSSNDFTDISLLQESLSHQHETDESLVVLSDLPPKKYVNTVARVVFIKSREKQDDLGKRPYIFGLAEDSTFRTPFICYKPNQTFFKDSVFKFRNAYVHEFDDHCLLLVLTEYSEIKMLPEEHPEKYVWQPKIGTIRRPLGRGNVALEGVVSRVYGSSGLIKRCENCARPFYEESCPSCGGREWYWSVRVSSKLSDETGSINTIFSQYLSCKLLGRSISDILCMAKVPDKVGSEGFKVELFKVTAPQQLNVKESTVVDPFFFRQCQKLIVPDKVRSKIYCPLDVKVVSKHVLDTKETILNYSDEKQRFLFGRILEKALDLEVRKRTRLPKLHGIYLTEEPVPLFRTEGAKLYLGFELNVSPQLDAIDVEFFPAWSIRESVLDYVNWRRSQGASAESIRNTLLKWKKNVILAPQGTIGVLGEVLFRDAGSFNVPTFDVPLPQFWKSAHDIDVKPDEKPLLVVKPYNLDVELTYPPSCVYFDEQSLYLKTSIWKFIDYKRSKLKSAVSILARDVMKNLRINNWAIQTSENPSLQLDAKRIVLNEIKQKILGKTVKATGSIIRRGDSLYFLPKTVEGVR
jgi:hypothetical protein